MFEALLAFRTEAQALLIVVIATVCFSIGDKPERFSGGTMLAMLIGDRAYHFFTGQSVIVDQVETWHFVIDVIACVALVAVALYANRMYTIWMGSFQIIAVFSHVAHEVMPTMPPMAYAILYIAPSYLQIFALVLGLWHHHKRTKEYGTYRAWRNFSPRSSDGGRLNLR